MRWNRRRAFVLKRTAVNDLVPAIDALQQDTCISPSALESVKARRKK
jgi:hypothetical protein